MRIRLVEDIIIISFRTHFSEADDYRKQGKFSLALQEVEKHLSNNKISLQKKLIGQMLKTLILSKQGYFPEALQLVNSIYLESKSLEDKKILFRCLLIKCEVLVDNQQHLDLKEVLLKLEAIQIDFFTNLSQEEELLIARLLDFKILYHGFIGEHRQAFDLAEKSLLIRKKTRETNELAKSYYSIGDINRVSGNCKKALSYFHKALKISEKNYDIVSILSNLFRMVHCYVALGDYKQGMKYSLKYQELCENQDSLWYIYLSHGLMSLPIYFKGELSIALEHLLKAQKIIFDFKNYSELGDINANIGVIYIKQGDPDNALIYLKQALEIMGNIQNDDFNKKSHIMRNIAWAYKLRGDLKIALDYAKKAVDNAIKSNNTYNITASEGHVGNIYKNMGDFENAIVYYKRALNHAIEINFKRNIAHQHKSLGECYYEKGDLIKATDHFEKSKEAYYEIDDAFGKSDSLYNLALINFGYGKLALAYENAKQCLQIKEKLKNNYEIAKTLFLIVRIKIDTLDIETAKKYSKKLNKIANTTHDKVIIQQNNLADAMLLKTSSLLDDKEKAEEQLLFIVEGEILDYQLSTIALINLCDLYLEKILIKDNPLVLQELQNQTNKLVEIAKKQKSHSLIIEAQHLRILAIWLQAQKSIPDINMYEIQSLMKNSQQMATNKGLIGLAQRIYNKHKKMLIHLQLWDKSLQEYFELISV